jgi:hypothetical protein
MLLRFFVLGRETTTLLILIKEHLSLRMDVIETRKRKRGKRAFFLERGLV